MRFEDHFYKEDIATAKIVFKTLVTSLRLIDSYTKKGDDMNAARTTITLTNALNDLNTLACRKSGSKDMYLQHLLTQPQGWYPA